jgi:NAD(P)-dependent dehydrogenase (short-subunit alcohol dehydrogenase family)
VVVDNDRSVIEVAFSDALGPRFGALDDPRSTPPHPTGDRDLLGRLAVVTGAAGMLGAAIAGELVARGAHVCLIGRDPDALRQTVDGLAPGAHTAMLRCDLASVEDVESAADFVERIGEPVDLLVHAAGMYAPTTIARGTVEELDEHYLLDVRGPYLLTQRLLPSLTDAAGRVVFFSVGGVEAGPDADVHRHISQAGLVAFAAGLRDEAAPFGIRVLTVRTDDVEETPGDLGAQEFLHACAARVLDLLGAGAVDVTDLHLRRGGRRTRSERR